jgi:hypothetical protein
MAQAGQLDNHGRQEAGEQLAYIEEMIREGRKTTEYWGWSLVLWGTAYLVAIAWGNLPGAGRSVQWAWPVTMFLATVLMISISSSKKRGRPMTTRSRAISAVWATVGCGIFLYAFPTAFAGRYGDGHTFTAGIEILLGVAQIACGIILRWRVQIAVGALWWIASLITTFTHTNLGVAAPFLAATFICFIGFGSYLMIREARDKAALRQGRVAHA